MELELVTEDVSQENSFVLAADEGVIDYPKFEGESCGICMDVVIDRGVLDCCQHWFCFACIDNWATITNLCPLCQNEFQLITCVPVYDTIGSSQLDEDLYSRDDDVFVEGKNTTFSFPSYYIDETAVVCLEGNDCKIRSRSVEMEEDSNLDTSIACDSCDNWYHAFCVGFDPDGSCENSWLCPRCLVHQTQTLQKSVGFVVAESSNHCHSENSGSNCLAEISFSKKVSVSIADAGETAVVVSMVEGNQRTEVLSETLVSTFDFSNNLKSGLLKSDSCANDSLLETPKQLPASVVDSREASVFASMAERTRVNEEQSQVILPRLDVRRHKWIGTETLSGKSSSRNLKLEAGKLELLLLQGGASSLPSNSSIYARLGSEPGFSDESGTCSGQVSAKLYKDEPVECGDLHHELHVPPASSDDKACPIVREKVANSGLKRKHRDNYRNGVAWERKCKMGNNISAKEPGRISLFVHSEDQSDCRVSNGPQSSCNVEVGSEDGNLRHVSGKVKASSDIRDIVREAHDRPIMQLAEANAADLSSKDKKNANGLRIKKIMRSAVEDKESSTLVQKLRKEIRDAIRNKSPNDTTEIFDPKLLAAFRAALAGLKMEIKNSSPLDLKAKKSLLQKGSIRENLTKKIYGVGGRRKRAWTRDCEIEFWKHRCLKISKPEKIETLKSVLNLLRSGLEISEKKQEIDAGIDTSILSRLYLADASVFPRKDGDIRPVSGLRATRIHELNKERIAVEKTFAASLCDLSSTIPKESEFSAKPVVASVDIKGPKFSSPCIKVKASSNKVHPNESLDGSSKATSRVSLKSETVVKCESAKIDKRKWALEVLARKTAVSGKNAAQEQEDNAVHKGNYPLLAQLPSDMRPVLVPGCQNKIPISVRQAQLYRLTEHFLRKAKFPVTQRTAEIELAVADAVNVEKQVADRSNSKLVYVNLCSQELLHRSDKAGTPDSNSCLASVVPGKQPDGATNDPSSSTDVDEALRNAGLLSDSPPHSPFLQMEETKEEACLLEKVEEEGPDNIFEIDSQPELDIYGDFEYDLEDEDFVGATSLKLLKLQQTDSKMKVVLSTLDSDRSNYAMNFVVDGAQAAVRGAEGSNVDNENPSEATLQRETDEELLPEDYEELYGRDKEPLISKIPEKATIEKSEFIPDDVPEKNKDLASNLAPKESKVESDICSENSVVGSVHHSFAGEDLSSQPQEAVTKKEKSRVDTKKPQRPASVFSQVEAYVKEHIRPLCKSGVITVEQYRWAVGKTADKIMKYHSKDKSANFLIKEGEKVKKLAEQYVEASQKL